MPKILLIADSDALWTKRAVEYLLLPAGYEIVIFPIWGHKGQFDDYYREHGVTVSRDPHRLPVIRHIPRVRMWARIALNARDLAKYGPFDVVHNHYLSQRDLALGLRVSRRFHARWVCTFWGSDLLRASSTPVHCYPTFITDPSAAEKLQKNDDWRCAFYVRTMAIDAPGVLSRVAATFADHGVSIAAMQQKGEKRDGRIPMVFITHRAYEKDMQQAVREIDPAIARVESLIRVEE